MIDSRIGTHNTTLRIHMHTHIQRVGLMENMYYTVCENYKETLRKSLWYVILSKLRARWWQNECDNAKLLDGMPWMRATQAQNLIDAHN